MNQAQTIFDDNVVAVRLGPMLTVGAVASRASRIPHAVFAASIFSDLHESTLTLPPWNGT